jgi:hypothetical protein
MNINEINPFNELYVTETVSPNDFVTLFSPVLIKDALPLFQPGNVVVKGVQGSGKSMLLSLLRPEIRIAYAKAGRKLPLPEKLAKFIGAGINFTRSAAIDFGQRATDPNEDIDIKRLPLYFGDFFNYWVILDIFRSIELLSKECDGKIRRDLGIDISPVKLDAFVKRLVRDECWFGYVSSVRDYQAFKKRIEERIKIYRRFLNFSLGQLPNEIKQTTSQVGQPISNTIQALWECGVVPHNIPIFIRVDQYEELCRLEDWSKNLGLKYARIVNKALGLRDPRVSYRIGARRYAWHDDLQLYGTTSVLELERDYKLVDIDEILRRKENRRTWIFPDFAEDVFARRLRYSGHTDSNLELSAVLTDNFSPTKVAQQYARNSPHRAIALEDSWPPTLRKFLKELAEENPLSAKLCEAWIRQGQKGALKRPFPWEKKVYWRKERIKQVLMHIAARCGQRLIWSGKDDVLALSGGNILVFVSLCQHIWSAWIRSVRGLKDGGDRLVLPRIESSVQAIGIQSASVHWYNKICEQLGRSRERQRFVNRLGRLFRDQLLNDKSMSYPGHNGFSLCEEELHADEWLLSFLNDAVDYGDLFDAPHTTKSKDRRQRRKWYLNPTLSPYFQIPETHVKEPMYVSVQDVKAWLAEAGIIDVAPDPRFRKSRRPNPNEKQLSFFPREGEN